jgi:hypothetical protein
MAAFEQAHGQFKHFGVTGSKDELLSAFRPGTSGVHLIFIGFTSHFPFHHHPGAALRTSYAGTHDPVRHLTQCK